MNPFIEEIEIITKTADEYISYTKLKIQQSITIQSSQRPNAHCVR